ncbi:MAG: hypothetical protein M0007_00580, partial [Actinomycetota bacterium]|nr:hypothetical protein [Actinomycetota bacterium]
MSGRDPDHRAPAPGRRPRRGSVPNEDGLRALGDLVDRGGRTVPVQPAGSSDEWQDDWRILAPGHRGDAGRAGGPADGYGGAGDGYGGAG